MFLVKIFVSKIIFSGVVVVVIVVLLDVVVEVDDVVDILDVVGAIMLPSDVVVVAVTELALSSLKILIGVEFAVATVSEIVLISFFKLNIDGNLVFLFIVRNAVGNNTGIAVTFLLVF